MHLGEACYTEDLTEVLSEARLNNVACMIVPATDVASWPQVLSLAADHKQLLPALGIQPHDAKEYAPELIEQLRELLSQAVAVGEIGLDFHYDLSPRPIQVECFRAHLRLARSCGLPVILHCRDAEEPFLSALRDEGVPQGGVVHCCTCEWSYVEQFLALGLHIGVTGMVTFPKLHAVHTIARQCPLERLLIETDGPYLAPAPFRGQRNQPAYVRRVSETIAQLRQTPEETIRECTTRNAISLFGPRVAAALAIHKAD